MLDLACGTGDLLFAAAARARVAVGLDITHRMLQLAAFATESRGRTLGLVTGDMLALPFRDARFDVVTTGYGLRNVPDLRAAIAEIHRVLAPGGTFLSLDFNRPRNPARPAPTWRISRSSARRSGSMLHGDPNTYRYIPESIRQYPGRSGVARLMDRNRIRGRARRAGARRPDGDSRRDEATS